VTHKIGHSFRERKHREEKEILPEISTNGPGADEELRKRSVPLRFTFTKCGFTPKGRLLMLCEVSTTSITHPGLKIETGFLLSPSSRPCPLLPKRIRSFLLKLMPPVDKHLVPLLC
jgi:hypothetical protein